MHQFDKTQNSRDWSTIQSSVISEPSVKTEGHIFFLAALVLSDSGRKLYAVEDGGIGSSMEPVSVSSASTAIPDSIASSLKSSMAMIVQNSALIVIASP